MNSEARRIVSLCPPASPWPRGETHSRQESITPADATKASRVRQIVEAVGRNISFDSTELPKEFFPAHLSIAIIEAVFRFQPGQEEQSSQIAKRYCRHFGLTHRRRNMFELPPVDEQETVAELIGHYDERGVKGMANEVFETSCRVPGTATCRAESVLHIAKALRHIGVDALQDVQDRPAQELEEALRSVPGMDGSMASPGPDVRGRRRLRRGGRPCAAIRGGGDRAAHGIGVVRGVSRVSGCLRVRPLAEASGLSNLLLRCRALGNRCTEAGRRVGRATASAATHVSNARYPGRAAVAR